MDTASSLDWAESALDVSTCLAPSHCVWSTNLCRFLTPVEHLALQGIWRQDSENHTAFDKLLTDEALCRDLAGNSFSGTVVQSALLSCFVTCPAWTRIGVMSPVRTPVQSPVQQQKQVVGATLVQQGAKRRKIQPESMGSGHVPSSGEIGNANSGGRGQDSGPILRVEEQGEPGPPSAARAQPSVPERRLRRKTTLAQQPRKPRRGFGGAGNKKGAGKNKMATLAEKELIMRTYLEAVEKGVKNPAKTVKNMNGYFKGCVYPSKWGNARKKQKWDIFTAAAPQICQTCKELPDSFRRILKWKARQSNRTSRTTPFAQRLHLPAPLQAVIDEMVVERLDLGEEVQIPFVKSCMLLAMETWNTVVSWLCMVSRIYIYIYLSNTRLYIYIYKMICMHIYIYINIHYQINLYH